jgi:hypothetical protein
VRELLQLQDIESLLGGIFFVIFNFNLSMRTWIEAYKERLERNHFLILEEAARLKDQGCRIYTITSERLVSQILVRKDEKHCFFGFADVPYRWYVSIAWEPSKDAGSGKMVITRFDAEKQPIETEEIMEAMMQDYPDFDRVYHFYHELTENAHHE